MAKIVVVEDDVYMREELLNLLEKSGYDTIGLSDFENAVSEIAAYFPDLILLDINLPFRSGFEICKELKAKQIGTVLAIPLAISIRKRNKADAIFRRFLLEPDDTNEYLLCEAVPAVIRPLICELGKHLRTQQEYINEQKITVTDYEHYVENWVHEIKKPLSLMTLLLDNRKDEMSPLVHTRMLYVRDHTRQDIEQILYFSRLGATHKDYSFESLSILGTCREAVEDNLTLLEEAGFSIEYTENDYQVISDKKGLMFILGQIISNSVKYVGNNLAPRLIFSIADSMNSEQISLSIKDNGTSIPLSDLPFVFDKGFTGDTGSYLSRSTGMGLYLVQKMATDLFITVELKNNSYGGTTVTLTFPKV